MRVLFEYFVYIESTIPLLKFQAVVVRPGLYSHDEAKIVSLFYYQAFFHSTYTTVYVLFLLSLTVNFKKKTILFLCTEAHFKTYCKLTFSWLFIFAICLHGHFRGRLLY